MTDDLEPLSPARGVEMYIEGRRGEVSEKTLMNHRYRLANFAAWCRDNGIDNMNELTGRDIHAFRTDRGQKVKMVTLVNQLRTIQLFLEFCAGIDAVPEGMREKVQVPAIEPYQEANDEQLEPERAKALLKYLERFNYASRKHVIALLIWHSGMRLGTLRSIDVGDFDEEAQLIRLRHRPETGTPLKNKRAAERSIAVSEKYCLVISDYIEHSRHDVQDEYGREPLITSAQGRLTPTPIRNDVYRMTQPCFSGECPHDKQEETCEWTQRTNLRDCPSARSPHAIRRGSITDHLRRGMPQRVIEERSNVTGEVLDQHYDERTEREKMESRREFVNSVAKEMEES